MYDIKLQIIGNTFKSSSASNFETYSNVIDINIKNRNADHSIHFVDTKLNEELLMRTLKKEECTRVILPFDIFKNKYIQIHTNGSDCVFIQIPNAGHVQIFVHVN